jgi:1-acyl-sn-glycerol-3-phosphate acyltransferase
MNFARSKLFDLFWVLWTAAFALPIPIFWLCGSPPAAIRAATRVWVRGTLFGLRSIVGLGYAERNREQVPQGPCLVVSNHQSAWETLAFLVLFPDAAVIAKRELLAVPIFGWYLRKSSMIVIDREDGPEALKRMVEEGRAALDGGRSVVIFPEGTRKAPTEPVEFKRGVGLLYSRLGVPALPVALNSGEFWGLGRRRRRPGTITLSYLPPIAPGLSASAFVRKAEALLELERSRLSPAGNAGF